jgi:hypothetical protein
MPNYPGLSRSVLWPGWQQPALPKWKKPIFIGLFSDVWLAIPAGFEPATHGVEIRYSIQLSYGTIINSIT